MPTGRSSDKQVIQMSTRSNIAIEHNDNTVSDIYCHSSGYLSGVGLTLTEHYPTRLKLRTLIALGDISSLGDTTASSCTTAYRRDRGEDGTAARTHNSLNEYFKTANREERRHSWGYEYCYILTKRRGWLVKQGDGPWEPLYSALVTENLLTNYEETDNG